jgi:predicted chitinase
MNRAAFYAALRKPNGLFGGKLSTDQVKGMETILNEWEASKLTDSRWLAYMLATTFLETATTMLPVLETRQPDEAANPSIDTAIARLESSWKRGRMPWVKTAYWRKDKDGKSWLGRGLVQLTHRVNYEKMSPLVGVDLVANPSAALMDYVAVKIMFAGMTKGIFTGKKLSDYFDGDSDDWTGARRIINGTDRAADVAGYAKKFHASIASAG